MRNRLSMPLLAVSLAVPALASAEQSAGQPTFYHETLCARIVLLLVLGGLFFVLGIRGRLPGRPRVLIYAVLFGALLSYPDFGFFHTTRSGHTHIHYWDAFHYFMGAKYLPELGYTKLYEATFVAGRELGAFGGVTHVRDLTSYTLREVGSIDTDAIRHRFSDARWAMFKRDLAFFGPHIDVWRGLLVDHGYNDPPPRALLLHLLVRWVPANGVTLTMLTSLDYLVIIGGFCVVWSAFGEIPAVLSLAFFSLSFFARFDFIGGSLLRWDWIVALLIAVSAFERGRGGTAGVFFGYAALARIFPVLFLLPLGIKWLQGWIAGRHEETLARSLRLAAALVVTVLLGVVSFEEGRTLLLEFVSKISRHSQAPAINSVGLGSLLVFSSAPWSLYPDGRVYVAQGAVLAALPAPYVLPLASALYLVVALPLILRARALESVMYAVPFIFCALFPPGYYYSFLVLLVLLPWRRGIADRPSLIEMAVLSIVMAVSYSFELVSNEMLPLFYQASIQVGLFFLLLITFEYVRLGSWGARLTAVSTSLDLPRQPSVPT